MVLRKSIITRTQLHFNYNQQMTNNSPQFRNLTFNETFESSLVERHQDKFTIDKSLINGIKQNDVSKIIDKSEQAGQQSSKELYDELSELENLLVVTRKKYDEVKTASLRSEKEIEKLRNNKEQLRKDQEKYNGIIDKQTRDLDETIKNLEKVNFTTEAVIYRKDIYLNMKDTLKKDILVLKKRYFDKDVILMRDKTKLSTVRTEHSNKIKLSQKCRVMLDSVEKTVHQKQVERSQKINSMCEVIARKQMGQHNKEIREREIQETMMSAMTDKLAEEKQWIRILQANMFLKHMLKAKMERLMEEHNCEELAFHRIKQATSIKTAGDFIDKFMNRQETYGMLLESINEKEQRLEEIKQEREDLQKSYGNTVQKSDEIIEMMKSAEPKQVTDVQKQLEQINEKLLTLHKQKQAIYQWSTKFLTSYTGKNREEIQGKFKKGQEKQLLREVLGIMKNFIDELNAQQDASKTIDKVYLKTGLSEKTLNSQMLEKNTRVKTQSAYEPGSTLQMDDRDVAYDDLSQIDYLQHNRRAIKKNVMQNRKFRIKTKPY